MTDLVMVKLGGSLITDKRGESAARHDVIERLAKEIAAALPRMREKLVVGHGSGSFGHAAAARHGIGRGPVAAGSQAGVSETAHQAARLHRMVLGSLLDAGAAPFSWSPGSAMVMRSGRPVSAAVGPLAGALERGLLPVTYGDVVTDLEWGAAICSTEQALRALHSRLKRRGYRVRRALWMGVTAGIYDDGGEPIPWIDRRNYQDVRRGIGATEGTDVTGGMLLRLETVRWFQRRGVESWIVDGRIPGLLEAGLLGEDLPGTRCVADG